MLTEKGQKRKINPITGPESYKNWAWELNEIASQVMYQKWGMSMKVGGHVAANLAKVEKDVRILGFLKKMEDEAKI